MFYCLLAKAAGMKCIVRTIHSTFTFQGMLKYRRRLTSWLERKLGVIQVSISPLGPAGGMGLFAQSHPANPQLVR